MGDKEEVIPEQIREGGENDQGGEVVKKINFKKKKKKKTGAQRLTSTNTVSLERGRKKRRKDKGHKKWVEGKADRVKDAVQ